jgi:hypothetical protein
MKAWNYKKVEDPGCPREQSGRLLIVLVLEF